MCQILVSFFKTGNVVYGSFGVKTLFIIDTLFSFLLNPINCHGRDIETNNQ